MYRTVVRAGADIYVIERLRSAGERLRAAWDNYIRTCSTLDEYRTLKESPEYFPLELFLQLDTELAFISLYESKIRLIKTAISRARNHYSSLAPINLLPPEILAHIFRLASPRSCGQHLFRYDNHTPRYPDNIAQVCHAWRNIAISTHLLWSHIDLSSHGSFCDELVSRADTHMIRSGNLPIELHISDSEESNSTRNYSALNQLLPRISGRVGTLVLNVSADFQLFHRFMLRKFLEGPPATLTNLVIRSETSHYNAFIHSISMDPDEFDDGSGNLILRLTTDQIEDCFSALTVLHLRGIFPIWSSKAYHGLVDLRLTSSREWSYITEAELVAILESSPGLRILYFGLEICGPTSGNAHIVPVYLTDLQVVNISVPRMAGPGLQVGSILRLLAPGTKPLRLTINNQYREDDSIPEVDKFFARSKVERFYTKFVSPPISMLLDYASNLTHIVFDNISPGTFLRQSLPRSFQAKGSTSPLCLGSLNVYNSFLFEDELRLLLKCCPTGIVLFNCPVISPGLMEDQPNTQLSREKLSRIFPTVSTTNYNVYGWEDPTSHWDLFD